MWVPHKKKKIKRIKMDGRPESAEEKVRDFLNIFSINFIIRFSSF